MRLITISRISAYLVLIVASIFAKAQTSNESFSASLASDLGTIWTLEAITGRLGVDDSCEQGIEWVFYTGGKLIKRTCVNGTFKLTKHAWSLSQSSSEPITLVIDSKTYWLEILTDSVLEPGFPPTEILVAKIQQVRQSQERTVAVYELRRDH